MSIEFLQSRDLEIIHFLANHGCATFNQIKVAFFNGQERAARVRLSKLLIKEVISTKPLKDYFTKRANGLIRGMFTELHSNSVIFLPSRSVCTLLNLTYPLMKDQMLFHQLIVAETDLFVKGKIGDYAFSSDPLIKIENQHTWGRDKTLTPDLIYRGQNFNMAIEVERAVKSINRYLTRTSEYSRSHFSHVLYVYSKETHLDILLKRVGYLLNIGFAHTLKLDRIHTTHYGVMTFNQWFERYKV